MYKQLKNSLALIPLLLMHSNESFANSQISPAHFSLDLATFSISQGMANRSFSWAINRSLIDERVLSKLDYQNIEVHTTRISTDLPFVFNLGTYG